MWFLKEKNGNQYVEITSLSRADKIAAAYKVMEENVIIRFISHHSINYSWQLLGITAQFVASMTNARIESFLQNVASV